MNLGWESWAAALSDRELSAQFRLPASWRSERGRAALHDEYCRRLVRHDLRDRDRHGLADVDPDGGGHGPSCGPGSERTSYVVVSDIGTAPDHLIASGAEVSDAHLREE